MEKFCLIGEKLGHSFSAQIHSEFGYEYDLVEIPNDKLGSFVGNSNYSGFNVTIPYKQEIFKWVDAVDELANEIGAINTVVFRNGQSKGYNTDIFGMEFALKYFKIDVCGKNVLILGSGGTSKTAIALMKKLGSKSVKVVSRKGKINYSNVYKETETEVIINTTPVGMFPKNKEQPIDLSKFKNIEGVFDVIYNPIKTRLILQAEEMSIPCGGGLIMLVAQAFKARELFIDKVCDESEIEKIYKKILKSKMNIVLIGMPSCGKTTIAKLVGERLGRNVLDTDQIIEQGSNIDISHIFSSMGEQRFREMESDAISQTSKIGGVVLSTGGGAVLNQENVKMLKQNGCIFYIKRSVDKLISKNRPLSIKNSNEKLFMERKEIYQNSCDFTIDNNASIDLSVEKLIKQFNDYFAWSKSKNL